MLTIHANPTPEIIAAPPGKNPRAGNLLKRCHFGELAQNTQLKLARCSYFKKQILVRLMYPGSSKKV